MNRLEELTLSLLDGTIGEAEVQELLAITRTAEGEACFHKLVELESHLQSMERSSIADDVVAKLQEQRRNRVEEGVMQTVSDDNLASPPANAVGSKRSSRMIAVAVGIAAVAACLLLALIQFDGPTLEDSAIATLYTHGSIVKVLDRNGVARTYTSREPLELREEQTIDISRGIESAEIKYSDGTAIELFDSTRVKVSETTNGSKQLWVVSGLIYADVSPQPKGRPMQIVTETAIMEVLGTTLGVEVQDTSTRLGVASGRVAMTRNADGQRVEVVAGRYATATDSPIEPLEAHRFPELPTEWSEDFEDGLPTGWRSGELVKIDDLKAVKTIKSGRPDDGRFVISSQNAWHEGHHGLCRIDEHSILHLRIRQSEFARITIMIGTRSYPPAKGRTGGNLFYTKQAWNKGLPADTWETISVPINDVAWHIKQGAKLNGAPALDGLAAYLIHVTTMHQNSELVIDRIWITHGPEELQQ